MLCSPAYPDLERDDILAALEFGARAAGGRVVSLSPCDHFSHEEHAACPERAGHPAELFAIERGAVAHVERQVAMMLGRSSGSVSAGST